MPEIAMKPRESGAFLLEGENLKSIARRWACPGCDLHPGQAWSVGLVSGVKGFRDISSPCGLRYFTTLDPCHKAKTPHENKVDVRLING